MQPIVRNEVHDAYWQFAAERQQIFHRRLAGEGSPWTQNPILARYKFCNAYRAADRVSQYLIGQVIYSEQARALSPEETFMRIILFRLFSKESTWEALEHTTGGVRVATLRVGRLGHALDRLRESQPIYTAAFILCAHDAYGHTTKHRNHLELVKRMFCRGALGRDLARARSLKDVYQALTAWPMIGPFMGYQLAIDLNYSEHLDFSEDEFTMPGPGALRGLRKVFSDFAGHSAKELIMRMVDRQEQEFDRLGLAFPTLFGRRLHAIDCQGLFCETDKYSRQAFPELTSNRSRIKQEYRPTGRSLTLSFPPKWGILADGPNDAFDATGACRPHEKAHQRPAERRAHQQTPIPVG
ncbi:MAG TPA: nucleotide kinase domain-containing protein [Solirubrobacteraceae bacterium]